MKRTVKIISALLSVIMVLGAVSVGLAGVFAAGNVVLDFNPYGILADPGTQVDFSFSVQGLGTDPDNNQISSVRFTSSDTSIVDYFTIGSPSEYFPDGCPFPTGLSYTVKAETFGSGTAIVTAEVTDMHGSTYTRSFPLSVRGISLSPDDVTLEVGEACVVRAERNGLTSAQSSTRLQWSKTGFDDMNWISLGNHGSSNSSDIYYIKANSVGTGIVSVMLSNQFSESISVTVVEKKSITIMRDGAEVTGAIELCNPYESVTLDAELEGFPDGTPVIWQSSDPGAVSVSPSEADCRTATVTAVDYSDKSVAVTATAFSPADGSEHSKTVYVTVPGESLSIACSQLRRSGNGSPGNIVINQGDTVTLSARGSGFDPTATVWSANTDSGRVPLKLNSTVGENITVTGRLTCTAPIAVTAENGGSADTVYVTVMPSEEKRVSIKGAELGADGVISLAPGSTSLQLNTELSGFSDIPEFTWSVSPAPNNENHDGIIPVEIDNPTGSSVTVTAIDNAVSKDFVKVTVKAVESGRVYTDDIYIKLTRCNVIKGARYLTVFKNDSVTLQTVNGSDAEWRSSSQKVYFGDIKPTVTNPETGETGAAVTAKSDGNSTSNPVLIKALDGIFTDSLYINVKPQSRFTARFDLNGGFGETPDAVTVSSIDTYSSIVLPQPDAGYPSDGGEYVFYGWSEYSNALEATGSIYKPVYFPGQSYYITENTVLYAVWAKKSEDAYFRLRLDGIIPNEPSNQDNHAYTLSGIYIEDALTEASFYYDVNGVDSHLEKLPSDADIARALSLTYVDGSPLVFDPDNDRIIWYVVKRVSDDAAGLPNWYVDGVIQREGTVSLTYDCNSSAANISRFPNPPRRYYSVDQTGAAYANIVSDVPVIQSRSFIGWNTQPDGSGDWFTSTGALYGGFTPPGGAAVQTDIELTEDTTLYAIWSGVNILAVWEDDGIHPDAVNVTFGGRDYTLSESGAWRAQADFYPQEHDYPVVSPAPGGYETSVVCNALEGADSQFCVNYIITFTPVSTEPEFDGHRLTLTDEINLQFAVKYPSGYDAGQDYMTFEVSDGKKSRMNFAAAVEDETEPGKYWFTCRLNALELADIVTATYHYGEETVSDIYMVMDDINYIKETLPAGDAVCGVVDALQNYGHFIYYSGWTDGREHNSIDSGSNSIDSSTVAEAYENTRGNDFTYDSDGFNGDVRFSLTLNSKTRMNFFVKPDPGDEFEIIGTGDNLHAAGTREINGETYYQFDTDKISPADLGRMTSYTIHTNSGDITLNASPMSYVRRIAGDIEYDPEKLLAIAAYYKYYESVCNLINQGN